MKGASLANTLSQRQVFAEYHLSLLLLDYAVYLSDKRCPVSWDEAGIAEIASSRKLERIYGDEAISRALKHYVHVNNMTLMRPSYLSDFTEVGCMLRTGLIGYCR